MRITEQEKRAIVKSVKKLDQKAAVYLYGSRINDGLKGGDLDLLVVSKVIQLSQKIDILISIKSQIGEQKIDLKIRHPEDEKDEFLKTIEDDLVELN